jgi:DegV family protein with EDD domain
LKILTDSAADLLQDEIKEFDITTAPLFIHFPDGELTSEQILPDDFYNRLRDLYPVIPTTSQPSSGNFKEFYERLLEDDDAVLSIHISSGLSGTIKSAETAAQQISGDRVSLVDTMTLSGGERFQVLAAARAIKAGWSKERILKRLDEIRLNTEVAFTLETLDYLAHGGRIGRVQALAGALLHIKPIISVDKKDGKYNTSGRARTMQKAMEKVAGYHEGIFGSSEPLWVTVLHGQAPEYANQLKEMLERTLNVARIEILRVSPVLGVHTGPGVIGAAVAPMKYFEDLD